MKAARRARKADRGQSLVEFALTAPIFIFLFLVVFDLGRGVFIHNTLGNAAREGARYGITHPADSAAIQSIAKSKAAGLSPTEVEVEVACSDPCTFGGDVTVRASYNFAPISPFLPAMRLTGVSTMYIE